MTGPRRITIMGATGSVGTSALSVIEHANSVSAEPEFEIDALVAGSDARTLATQAKQFGARLAVIADESQHELLAHLLLGTGIEVASGLAAVTEAATRPVDRVLAAIVGIAGLPSTLAAIEAGNSVALANKESMVCAGPLLKRRARERDVHIIPTDSEHNAMFQVMERHEDVERLILTASGGPFRLASLEAMAAATPSMAIAHPKWDMGPKISVDSASLFNKGLELIEAAYLFDIPEDRIDVVVHPQSIIHSLVSYRDGSVLAQMGQPDMCTPISHALSWPGRRVETKVKRLDLVALSQLDFEALDLVRFPAIRLARHALVHGGGAPTVLNCANEHAVAAFLSGQCRFTDISWIVEQALEHFLAGPSADQVCDSLAAVMAIQAEAVDLIGALLAQADGQNRGA